MAQFKTLEDLLAAESPPWTWEGYLAPGAITLFSAPPKTGKTTFLSRLIKAMWTQDTFLGLQIHPKPMLIISEESDGLLGDRCQELEYSPMWPIFWMTPEPGRSWEHVLANMRWFALHFHQPLIILDTLSRHWGIEDENDNAKVEALMGPLIAMTRKDLPALLLVHHLRKSGGSNGLGVRGGSALAGAVDILMELKRTDKDESTNRRRLDANSRYRETPEHLMVQLDPEGYVLCDPLEQQAMHVATSNERATKAWMLVNPGWWAADSIAAALHSPVRTIRDGLDLLLTMEEIVRKGNGRRGNPYQYSATEDAPDGVEEELDG